MRFYFTYLFIICCFAGFAQHPAVYSKMPAKKAKQYADSSVLARGTWVMLKVSNDGVYKITYNDLLSYGIDPSAIDPHDIRIFGNGGAMLPESNASPAYDDLIENAIYVKGESDGHFDLNDYILFFGQSPVKWTYDNTRNIFLHSINYYSDYSCYFLTFDRLPGKRIQPQDTSSLAATNIVTNFNDYLYHEKDSVNLINSGKEWYGEYFNAVNSYNFTFNFPDIDVSSRTMVRANIAARGLTSTTFNILANGYPDTITIAPIPGTPTADFAKSNEDTMGFYSSSSAININISKNTAGNVGWLNFVDVNAARKLIFRGQQLMYRNVACTGAGNVSEFIMNNANPAVTIWDITDPLNIRQQKFMLNGSTLTYRLPSDTLHQFIAFDTSSFLTPLFAGNVPNQNLHSLAPADLVIVAYPDFLVQANRLAAIHANHDNFSVAVVTPQQIYNEFSSGSQDVAAIRNFLRMMYQRSDSANRSPKYLLLFGNASYDYKNHFGLNLNFVPAYESYNSLIPTASYVTDDFFGILDSTGGYSSNGSLDIGVGRFPVRNTDEAKTLVDKVESYLKKINSVTETNGCTIFTRQISGDWRNMVCFVADDEDNDLHIGQADELASTLDTANNNFNINKIYLDAYVQVSGPNGDTYPDVNKAIDKQVQDGALMINYTGHGGETGWADEKVLQESDINGWTNITNMPAFVTASCEFSRFDDPNLVSAGELVILSSTGGGIALFTTTRVAFSNSNFALNKSLCKYAFKKMNGEYNRLGDIIRLSKIDNGSIVNIRNFILLGDPALMLAYPENNVVTTSVNGHPAYTTADTLKAFSKVTITGIIQSPSGNKLTDFNGFIYPTVYDKKNITTTLANDPASEPFNFYQQNKILYKGKATVTNGDFTFSFILPKDMNENYGQGKISYYAQDSNRDASGFYDNSNFILGGIDSTGIVHTNGPSVRLFLNDTNFVSGGTTDTNPLLISLLADSAGINANGSSIGHNITAVLDDNTEQTIVLNDYYTPDVNTYKGGVVTYPFINLSEGLHTLSLKAWNIYDISAEAKTEFFVTPSKQLSLKNIYNYPNPFSSLTWFFFEHNQPCCELDVEIDIYSIIGEHVKTIHQNVTPTGNILNSISWDGRSDGGSLLESGVYPYQITVKTVAGSYLRSFNKLIFIKGAQ